MWQERIGAAAAEIWMLMRFTSRESRMNRI